MSSEEDKKLDTLKSDKKDVEKASTPVITPTPSEKDGLHTEKEIPKKDIDAN